MPALVHLVKVGELRVAALRPAPGGLVDLAGEDGDRRRDGEVLGAEVRELVLPVAAGRGDPGVCEPVEGDVVEHVVPRQPLRGLSLGRRAHRHEDCRGRLVVAVAVVDQPGREADRRIGESVERLRTRRHLQRVGRVLGEEALQLV